MFFGIRDKQTASSQCEILSLKFDENVFSPENKSPEEQRWLLWIVFHFPEKHDQFCINSFSRSNNLTEIEEYFNSKKQTSFILLAREQQTISNSVKFSIMQSNELLRNTNFEISDKYKTFQIIYFSL